MIYEDFLVLEAQGRLADARAKSDDPSSSRRGRRAAGRTLPDLEAAVAAAEHEWAQVGEPEAAQLRTDIEHTNRELKRLSADAQRERLDQLQVRGASRSVGVSQALGH